MKNFKKLLTSPENILKYRGINIKGNIRDCGYVVETLKFLKDFQEVYIENYQKKYWVVQGIKVKYLIEL